MFPRMWLFALVSCQNISLHKFNVCQLPLCETVLGVFPKLKCFRNFGQFYRQTVWFGCCGFNSVCVDCLFVCPGAQQGPWTWLIPGLDPAMPVFSFYICSMKQMTEQSHLDELR